MVEAKIHGQGNSSWGNPEITGTTGASVKREGEFDPENPRTTGIFAIRVRTGALAPVDEKLRQIPQLRVNLVAGDYDFVARFGVQTFQDLREVLYPAVQSVGDLSITTLIHMTRNLVTEPLRQTDSPEV